MKKFFNNIIINYDAPKPWGLYFQDTASPQMEALVELHDNIMFYLVIILFGVAWILLSIIRNYVNNKSPISNKYLNHGTLELIWTIAAGFILIFPSFKLLYLMDEITDSSFTISVKGDQWYLNYQYPDFFIVENEELEFDSYLIPESELEELRNRYILYMNDNPENVSPNDPPLPSGNDTNPLGGDNNSDDDSEKDLETRGIKRGASETPELVYDKHDIQSKRLTILEKENSLNMKITSINKTIGDIVCDNDKVLSADLKAILEENDIVTETALDEQSELMESEDELTRRSAKQAYDKAMCDSNRDVVEGLRNEPWLTAEDRATLVGVERLDQECKELLSNLDQLHTELIAVKEEVGEVSSDFTSIDSSDNTE